MLMNKKGIDARLKNIQGLFSGANSQDSILGSEGIYIIPEYQRAYNWKSNEQCDKLWQDIEDFINERKNDTYFFGSIIINSDSDNLYIIDGQQRITTFMLLLKALLLQINKCLLNISNDEDSQNIKEALENRRKNILTCLYTIDEDDVSKVVKGITPLSALKLKYQNESMNEEYAEDIGSILYGETFESITPHEIKYKQGNNRYSNFFKNFKYFKERLEKYNLSKLNTFAKKFLTECQVIVIVSYQTDEAIEIFNSLNSTGMPLADADILSAELYRNAPTKNDKNKFIDTWKNIIKATNELKAKNICSIDDILNQYMYILRAKNHETDTTLPSVRNYFMKSSNSTIKDVRLFIDDFEKIIAIWAEESDKEADVCENHCIENILNLKQILFQMNNNFKFYYATYLFFNQKSSIHDIESFIIALLKLFALLSISSSGYSTKYFKTFLISLNMKIGAGTPTNELVQLIDKHIKESFSKNEIKQLLCDTEPKTSIVYLNEYLFAIENHETINLSTQKIEIEHIMPASGKNIASIREDAKMDADTFSQYVNKLGNKILLEQSINGAIGNAWFRCKKQNSIKEKRGYKDSAFPIAKSLTEYKKDLWEKEDIDAATEKAAQRIVSFIFE